MGLYTRRHDSSPGPFPPPPPTISVPPPVLSQHIRHESSPFPFLQISPQPQTPLPHDFPQDDHHTIRHRRRESLPGASFPPTSPPPASRHSRRDSYPGPFSSLPSPPSSSEPPPLVFHARRETTPGPFPSLPSPPSSSSEPPPLIFHARRETCPGPFTLSRHESDPSLLPSTSASFLNHHHRQVLCNRFRRRLDLDLAWPFGELEGVDDDDIRETAYEVFFTACRSCPGFGGRSALTFHSKHENDNGEASPLSQQTSRVKRALGLKMLRSPLIQRMASFGRGSGWLSMLSAPAVESSPRSRAMPRRNMTMAEVMRLQMGVSEQSDGRLRKTLMRTLVGQVS